MPNKQSTVLWIDDDALCLDAVRTLLGDLGRELVFACSVEEGLTIARANGGITLAILDAIVPINCRMQPPRGDETHVFQLPHETRENRVRERNGMLFLEECKAQELSIECCAIVSFVSGDLLSNEFDYKYDHYFHKLALPDQIPALTDLIRTAIHSRCEA